MACSNWFDCTNEKRKNLGFLQILQLLITGVGADDCPAVRVTGEVSGSFTPTTLTNAQTTDIIFEEDDNTLLLAALNAWKTANGSFKVISKVQINSINKQALLVTYTT